MVNESKFYKALQEWHMNRRICGNLPVDIYLINPILEALGDDADEILAFLNTLDIEDLDEISGSFEYIFEKWRTDEVWNALTRLEQKIKGANL